MTTPKGPATEVVLGELHSKVAQVMSNALNKVIDKQENPDVSDEGVELEAVVNPALLSVITKFLDTNKITCAPSESGTMSELESKLKARQQTRRQVGNVVHLTQDEE